MDAVPRRPDSAPFAHSGARVDIEERSARSIGGGYGMLAAAVLVAVGILLITRGQYRFVILPALAVVAVLGSLVVVQQLYCALLEPIGLHGVFLRAFADTGEPCELPTRARVRFGARFRVRGDGLRRVLRRPQPTLERIPCQAARRASRIA